MKKLISVFMCVCLIVGMVTYVGTSVSAEYGNDFEYVFKEDKTIEITDYLGKDTSVIVPSEINGFSVTSIGDSAFSNCKTVESFVLPDVLTNIGAGAFYKCVALKKITIPQNVTSISPSAFSNCSSLSDILVDGASTYFSSVNGVLFSKDMKTLITYPAGKTDETYTVPNGVEVIGDSGFYHNDYIKEINFPDSLKTFELYAVSSCDKITSLTIPKNVSSIHPQALKAGKEIENIYVDEGNNSFCSENGVLYNKDKTILVDCPRAKSESVFTVPDGVTSVGEYSFEMCKFYTINLPIGLKSIEDNAFYSCRARNINFPEGLERIGKRAFEYCDIRDVIIPDTVTSIEKGAFQSTLLLNSITIPGTLKQIESYTFYRSSLKSITIGEGVTEIGSVAFAGCYNLETIELPSSVKTIGSSAFGTEIIHSCGIKSISMPGVEGIGENAFEGCYSLEKISLPDTLKTIGKNAFNHSGLKSIFIPKSVTEIGDYAFYNCGSLTDIDVDSSNVVYTSVDGVLFTKDMRELLCFPQGKKVTEYVVPEGVQRLNGYIYSESGLNKVTIPASVNYIEPGMFAMIYTLKEISVNDANSEFTSVDGVLYSKDKTQLVQYPIGKENSEYTILSGVTNIGPVAFEYSKHLTRVDIPDTVKEIGYGAFLGCAKLEGVVIPSGVTKIGSGAFNVCSSIKTVVIPEGVTVIENSTFSGCSALESVTIPTTIETIGDYAFLGCAFTSITIPNGGTTIGYDAFNKEKLLEIKGLTNSDAERYAKENDITFVSLGIYVPTPKPTPVPTIDPNATSAATVTPAPTVTPTPTQPVKKSVKFKKKKVTIKVGKKAVLKVTIKGAKKAKFSVNKKGKKIVKLMNKKAKRVTVKGKKKGKATITAKAAGKKATCKVTVKKKKK